MLAQEATQIERREAYTAAINNRYGFGTRQALYWQDYVTDLIDDLSDTEAATLEAHGWPNLLESLEEDRFNSQNP